METIKETLNSLSEPDKARLFLAFEHGLAQYIELPNDRFIGVNVSTIKALKVDAAAGNWAVGTTK